MRSAQVSAVSADQRHGYGRLLRRAGGGSAPRIDWLSARPHVTLPEGRSGQGRASFGVPILKAIRAQRESLLSY